jgi:hypothetical protein
VGPEIRPLENLKKRLGGGKSEEEEAKDSAMRVNEELEAQAGTDGK